MIHVCQGPKPFKPRQVVANPWGLTCGQADVMDALCAIGDCVATSKRLGISAQRVRNVLGAVRKKMQTTTIRAAVLWARWRDADGKDVPC